MPSPFDSTRETQNRPDWDTIWMTFVHHLAQRSSCYRAQVGCVVVTEDNHRVLAVGYNGGPKGLLNGCVSDEPGKCGCLHAEMNALLKMDYNEPAGKKAYVTMMPCYNCSVGLVNAGIQEVIYRASYRDESGVRLLEKAGIKVWQYTGDVRLKEDRMW